MRDRLIQLIESARYWGANTSEALAESLISEGLLVLPCKLGQIVYYPSFSVGKVFLYKVISIKINSKGIYIVIDNRLRNEQFTHRVTQVGKTVFLTREEAEKALKERSENGT